MLVAGALMWALDRWLPLAHWIGHPWNTVAGLPVAAAIAVIAAALTRFRRARTSVNPVDLSKTSRLVTDGIFSVTRNPMYLGLSLLLAGWALWLGSASPWLVPPLFVMVITLVQIIPEEQVLSRMFGEHYLAYQRRVARWIGLTR
jgi:protein-S-isoprenylcysteine O-methyltransferase Ste14